MTVQRPTETSPQPTDPSHDAASEDDRTSTNCYGKRYEKIAAYAIGKKGQRCQQGDFPERRATQAIEDLHRIEIYHSWRTEQSKIKLAQNLRVDARIFKGEDGNECSDDDFGRDGQCSNYCAVSKWTKYTNSLAAKLLTKAYRHDRCNLLPMRKIQGICKYIRF
jgi:hypothetical protein